jgi:diguanylate cyclase (GGDEF)-like protein/PAS domain S-box-containing protein
VRVSHIGTDGQAIQVELTASPLLDGSGQRIGTIVVARSIASAERTPTSVAEAEERQQLLLASLPDTIVALYDRELRCVLLDGPMVRRAGIDPSRYLGRPIEETLPGDQYATLAGPIRDALSGLHASLEWTSAISGITYEMDVAPYRLADGTIDGAFAVGRDVTGRRDQERLLANAQAVLHGGSWELDLQEGRLIWSDELCRIAGYPLGSRPTVDEFLEMIHPEDRQILVSQIEDAKDGAGSGSEYRFIRPDGGIRHVHTTRFARTDANGNITALHGITLDITDRVAREFEVRRLASIVEHSAEAMATKDASGIITAWNAGAERLYGYSSEEAIGQPITIIIPPDRLGEADEFLAAALAGQTISQRETARVRKDGSLVEVSVTVSPLRDHQGKPVGASIITRDVTERNRRDHEMQRLAAIVEHSAEAITASDAEGVLTEWNAGAERLYGYTAAQALGQPITLIAPPDRLDEARKLRERALTGETVIAYETVRMHKNGSMVDVSLTVSALRDRHGDPVGVSVVARDITAMRQAQAREAETKQRLQTVMENLVGSAVTLYDHEHRLRFCEGPLFAQLNLDSMLGQKLSSFVTPGTLELLTPLVEGALNGQTGGAILDGYRGERSLAIQATPYRMASGEIEGALVHWHEITAVRQAERDRDEANERFRIAFDRAPIGMAIVELDGRLQRVNEALCEISGHQAGDLISTSLFGLVHPDDLDVTRRAFDRIGHSADTIRVEHRISRTAGDPRWAQTRVTLIRNDDGEPVHALAQILDVTDRRAYEQRLQHEADHDPLTRLFNRRGFESALDLHLSYCRRYGASGAMLALDLDGFKNVNDTLGHAAGDELMMACADTLKTRLRDTDAIARLGGDEFAVLLPTATEAEAVIVAQALVDALRERTSQELPNIDSGGVTASIGVTMLTDDRLTSAEILSSADDAMYRAKEAGKNRYAL